MKELTQEFLTFLLLCTDTVEDIKNKCSDMSMATIFKILEGIEDGDVDPMNIFLKHNGTFCNMNGLRYVHKDEEYYYCDTSQDIQAFFDYNRIYCDYWGDDLFLRIYDFISRKLISIHFKECIQSVECDTDKIIIATAKLAEAVLINRCDPFTYHDDETIVYKYTIMNLQ